MGEILPLFKKQLFTGTVSFIRRASNGDVDGVDYADGGAAEDRCRRIDC